MKGLRQGDLLSPLIFILATNTLQAMFHKLQNDLIHLPTATTSLLQFADDTIIITSAHTRNIKLIMAIFNIFGELSGLKINLHKSGFLLITIPPDLNPTIASLIGCPALTAPIQYLGLPLTSAVRGAKSTCLSAKARRKSNLHFFGLRGGHSYKSARFCALFGEAQEARGARKRVPDEFFTSKFNLLQYLNLI
jgi:Reverse transcriptase (RNA-dependent DNA polymerase)